MQHKGTFIVFEGGEGSGKSHHAQALVYRLQAEGRDVLLTHEPGGTGSEVGKAIREIILRKDGDEQVHARTELLLFLANRAQHVEGVILPALAEGKIVICDRFSGSTFAYQLGGRELPDPEMVKNIDAYARAGLEPDRVVFLDVDPAVGLQRRRSATPEALNRIDTEELAFHERVHNYFVQLASDPKWVTVSTQTGTIEENQEKVYSVVKDML